MTNLPWHCTYCDTWCIYISYIPVCIAKYWSVHYIYHFVVYYDMKMYHPSTYVTHWAKTSHFHTFLKHHFITPPVTKEWTVKFQHGMISGLGGTVVRSRKTNYRHLLNNWSKLKTETSYEDGTICSPCSGKSIKV